MKERFISEAIQPAAGEFDPAAMAAGEPALPARFRWRDRDYEVADLLESWRELSPSSFESDRYLRRHWFRIRTDCGSEMVLYFQRRARDVRAGKRWWLYTVTEDEPLT